MSVGQKTFETGVVHVDPLNKIVVAETCMMVEDADGIKHCISRENIMFSLAEYFPSEPDIDAFFQRVKAALKVRDEKKAAVEEAAKADALKVKA